jgi:hypothetical protein
MSADEATRTHRHLLEEITRARAVPITDRKSVV